MAKNGLQARGLIRFDGRGILAGVGGVIGAMPADGFAVPEAMRFLPQVDDPKRFIRLAYGLQLVAESRYSAGGGLTAA